jgi:hypothetical protein
MHGHDVGAPWRTPTEAVMVADQLFWQLMTHIIERGAFGVKCVGDSVVYLREMEDQEHVEGFLVTSRKVYLDF